MLAEARAAAARHDAVDHRYRGRESTSRTAIWPTSSAATTTTSQPFPSVRPTRWRVSSRSVRPSRPTGSRWPRPPSTSSGPSPPKGRCSSPSTTRSGSTPPRFRRCCSPRTDLMTRHGVDLRRPGPPTGRSAAQPLSQSVPRRSRRVRGSAASRRVRRPGHVGGVHVPAGGGVRRQPAGPADPADDDAGRRPRPVGPERRAAAHRLRVGGRFLRQHHHAAARDSPSPAHAGDSRLGDGAESAARADSRI